MMLSGSSHDVASILKMFINGSSKHKEWLCVLKSQMTEQSNSSNIKQRVLF